MQKVFVLLKATLFMLYSLEGTILDEENVSYKIQSNPIGIIINQYYTYISVITCQFNRGMKIAVNSKTLWLKTYNAFENKVLRDGGAA